MNHDRILILDFGSQVTQLIARRVREAHVYCEVHASDVGEEFIREFNPKGIILSGSYIGCRAYQLLPFKTGPAVVYGSYTQFFGVNDINYAAHMACAFIILAASIMALPAEEHAVLIVVEYPVRPSFRQT